MGELLPLFAGLFQGHRHQNSVEIHGAILEASRISSYSFKIKWKTSAITLPNLLVNLANTSKYDQLTSRDPDDRFFTPCIGTLVIEIINKRAVVGGGVQERTQEQ
ncbi:hypothetical protein AAC387_Pa04g0424 [Persea americana]